MAEIGDGAVGGVLGRRRLGSCSRRSAPSKPRAASATAATSRLAQAAASTALAARCDMSLLRAPRLAVVTRISSPADWKVTVSSSMVRAEALGEEAAVGMAQPRLRLAAFQVDRQRIGIDQRLPHGFRGDRAVGERATLDLRRQRGVAIAAGDLRDCGRRSGAKSARNTTPPRSRRRVQRPGRARRLPVPHVVRTATTPTNRSGNTIHAGSGLLNLATISGQFQLAGVKIPGEHE